MPTRKNRKLNAADRQFIERSINGLMGISEIAARLGVSVSTVIREIKVNGTTEHGSMLSVNTRNVCVKQKHCTVMCLCDNGCLVKCSKCKEWKCNRICPEFEPERCKVLENPRTAATRATEGTVTAASTSTGSTTRKRRTSFP